MVSVVRRMRKLHALLSIRLGPGAAILPQNVQRIHLDFATRFNDGHMGPRKFWRTHLPRLKYHNPRIPMTVTRSTDQSAPATLTLFFASPPPPSPPPSESSPSTPPSAPISSTGGTAPSAEYTPFERTASIPCKHRTDAQIWAAVLETLRPEPGGVVEVVATSEEESQMVEMREREERGAVDRERLAGVREERRRRDMLVRLAKGEVVEKGPV